MHISSPTKCLRSFISIVQGFLLRCLGRERYSMSTSAISVGGGTTPQTGEQGCNAQIPVRVDVTCTLQCCQ
jgi:hypothetical protein